MCLNKKSMFQSNLLPPIDRSNDVQGTFDFGLDRKTLDYRPANGPGDHENYLVNSTYSNNP